MRNKFADANGTISAKPRGQRRQALALLVRNKFADANGTISAQPRGTGSLCLSAEPIQVPAEPRHGAGTTSVEPRGQGDKCTWVDGWSLCGH